MFAHASRSSHAAAWHGHSAIPKASYQQRSALPYMLSGILRIPQTYFQPTQWAHATDLVSLRRDEVFNVKGKGALDALFGGAEW
ncbi:hypothetical protein JHL21_16525 [Devosia sp. WQ 349]|uniref:hypothetical protein n=1 Tax=Devosia sp. WQ 349K1 TaxID=2800329 RepID=UPI00190345FE|nr:hypothetical protein [Devosia sp. WQ 349K1]MBK1796095.1 hypothetical protein [Devosia sp. WQ 349K1]